MRSDPIHKKIWKIPALRHLLAEQGMDVCLVKMPFHLAFFGINRAASVLEPESYKNRYIGGHSLGGAMAAVYAAQTGDPLSGVILIAAYPTKPLPEDTQVLCLFGTEDGVLNLDKVYEGEKYAPGGFFLHTISGGNHAQFGNYGTQKGDGTALISAEEQQEETVEAILNLLDGISTSGNLDLWGRDSPIVLMKGPRFSVISPIYI